MRFALAAPLGVIVVIAALLAQGPPPDTLLHLKSGEQVRGKLVEIKNGAYVLALPDGRTLLYPTTDVETAERIAAVSRSGATGGMALLAPGHRVFVRPVPQDDKATHELLSNLLRDWGRWKMVEKAEDADILVRLEMDDIGAATTVGIIATIEDVSSGTALWKAPKQTGRRAVWNGYENPYRNAAKKIFEKMKQASAKWPER